MLAEELRLQQSYQRQANWHRWGPYLSERQWGTVREDYSANGDSWHYFPHDQARSRAYRWGEDGLLGICDRECRLCFGLALWNGRDTILKERLFGLTGPEGNHGEDVKEMYFYLDSTPTHSYMKALYKYPQTEFPYETLVGENQRRSRHDPEFELEDTGIFNESRYFDVYAEYAKAAPDDLLIRITVANRASETATIHLLPTLWFRNTWSWGCDHEGCERKPGITRQEDGSLVADHASLERFRFFYDHQSLPEAPAMLITENETNAARLFGLTNGTHPSKDAFHDYVIDGNAAAVSTGNHGTKAAPHLVFTIPAHGEVSIRLRLLADDLVDGDPFDDRFEKIFADRIAEANQFYDSKIPESTRDTERTVARQAYAGLLWSKQFYHYAVEAWLEGDPEQPVPPASRFEGRNHDWTHLFNRDVISMPDKWEYPWYAAWDLAFHMIPMATIDPEFAKSQLLLMLREWYMHPNGQIPAYEFGFSDVNPPVHAWSCWRVYKMTGPSGLRDRDFLARAFQKLLINFTWWINRKDINGKHLFSGGFLGLDNVGVFDRSKPLPDGGQLEQADGTAWMAFYCATMLSMALELAQGDPTYEDVASKFFEHFVQITDAMNCLGDDGLWDEEDGFYYDQMRTNGQMQRMKIRSIVGVIPLFAVEVLEDDFLQSLPGFRKRMEWFLKHRRDLAQQISYLEHEHDGDKHAHRLLAIPSQERLQRVLRYVLDENEFLSPHGIRSMSRFHADHPFTLNCGSEEYRVDYVPGESNTSMFGGNSNWRGPIWFPVNYLLIEALERYHHFYGDSFKVECPTGSGQLMTLQQVAHELSQRLSTLFLPDGEGQRPCHGGDERFATDTHWRDLVLFYEYFHGDTGRGMGASHQTGWTALVTRLLGAQCSASHQPRTTATPSEVASTLSK
ncbi:MAG: Mannosyl oligosaccharide glucosidase [Schlesneria sp.]|nr:Mannosyl oligosaccharide glucosidase [Schlesneria sp.]